MEAWQQLACATCARSCSTSYGLTRAPSMRSVDLAGRGGDATRPAGLCARARQGGRGAQWRGRWEGRPCCRRKLLRRVCRTFRPALEPLSLPIGGSEAGSLAWPMVPVGWRAGGAGAVGPRCCSRGDLHSPLISSRANPPRPLSPFHPLQSLYQPRHPPETILCAP